jgi:protease I
MAVGLFVAPLFEDSELIYPYYRLQEAGHEVLRIGTKPGTFESKHGYPMDAEVAASDIDAEQLEGLVIPGGYGPDHLRRDRATVELTRKVFEAGKPVAAICHAGWMLISAGIAEGRRLTSFHSIKDDMVAAGSEWVDESVVVDGNLITSRYPADLPAFMEATLAALEKS